MFALSFQFPARRYHATPWGRAVNEAEVAWPPEPWRLLRALIAAHWRKGDHSDESAESLQQLIQVLARELPVYELPTGGIHAHTRHYMPLGVLDKKAGREKTALVFDAFARLPKDKPLTVAWPDVTLDPQLFRYATDLASSVGYLGRAESWTECTALNEWNGVPNCVPLDQAMQGHPIRLLAPLSAAEYRETRDHLVAGLRPKSKAVQKKILRTLPERLVDALTLETADYQAQGWSRPPASREAIYSMKPEAALGVKSRNTSQRQTQQRRELPTVARFLVAGRPLPRVEDSIKIGELMRLAALSKFGWEKDGATGRNRPKAPWQISGRDKEHRPLKDPQHAHAFWLPEDADGDGWIDHISVFIAGGMELNVQRALDRITRLWMPGTHDSEDSGPDVAAADEWRLALEGFGKPADFAGSAPIFGTSTRWRSTTPFLASGHLKPAGYPKEARRLLKMRGIYQEGTEIRAKGEIEVGSTTRRPVHFHRFRSRGGEKQFDAEGTSLHIAFPCPIEGPLAFGYGSHFGLGLFVPDDHGDGDRD